MSGLTGYILTGIINNMPLNSFGGLYSTLLPRPPLATPLLFFLLFLFFSPALSSFEMVLLGILCVCMLLYIFLFYYVISVVHEYNAEY